MKKAVVLLSGGLDSAVTLYLAKKQRFKCFCLLFDYGQRHRRELASAKKIARASGCAYKILKINLPWKGSALLDKNKKLPGSGHRASGSVPSTYVPGRNIIFLSFALSYAEAIGARALFIGAHTEDYSDYPDCRRQFFRAFEQVIKTGTKVGSQRKRPAIIAPLLNKSKSEIIKLGARLGVPFNLTWSCYQGGLKPCAICDSCYYRRKGFRQAGLIDPLDK